MGQEQKLVKQFDKNKDDRLDVEERKAARSGSPRTAPAAAASAAAGAAGAAWRRARPGRALKPADVKSYTTEPLYDPRVLRTIFLQFENADWEQELAAFNNTDVEVPAVVIGGRQDLQGRRRPLPRHVVVHDGARRIRSAR